VSEGEATRILQTAVSHMADALPTDERHARDTANREANDIMGNMMTAYHQRLDEMRLLEVLQLVYPGNRAEQDGALANHMRWMASTARSTLRHDPSLWGDQAHRQLEVRAHLAIDYEDERERQEVERARQSVGGFGERGPGYVPPGELVQSNDRARLQLLFSHHGISISAVPFLADAAGGCVKSLKDRQRIWETQGGIPVFTCDVMQELVLRPGMFFDPLYEKAMGGATAQTAGGPSYLSAQGSGSPIPPHIAPVSPDTGVYGDGSPGNYSSSPYATTGGPGLPPAPSGQPFPTQPRNLVDRVERRARS